MTLRSIFLVFIKLVERFLDRTLPKRARSGNVELLTIFQYLNHIEEQNVPSLPAYIMEVADEGPRVFLVQNLQSSDRDVVLKNLKHLSGTQLQKDGLKAVGLLLLEDNTKICNTAASVLKNLSEDSKFREKALVCYLELLEDEDEQLRKVGCTALAHLKSAMWDLVKCLTKICVDNIHCITIIDPPCHFLKEFNQICVVTWENIRLFELV
eukprot:g45130.t1